ncbi:MAG: class I SAM-dependent methyltransferase [Oscillospiraceae bacterium]|nr:class I SAM-dependent methyltransferase [Oscillospiraceae bacterium]
MDYLQRNGQPVCLYIAPDAEPDRAAALAKNAAFYPLDCPPEEGRGVWLLLNRGGLSLTDGVLVLKGDFTELLPRLKNGRLQGELLVKAAKIKHPEKPLKAIDATAGLGEDALLLAASGFHVTLCEQDPVIAALLADALCRADRIPELAETVSRMTLQEGDSISMLQGMHEAPDVVYLDPMFPERKKSALIKKKFQLLHYLQAPCENGEELVRAAYAAGPRKVIIKRPLKGEWLAGIKPGYSISGKAVRYDCLIPPPK